MNIHFTDAQPGELAMIAAAGFRWVRMDLTWEATEKEPGQYDFSAYDRLVAGLEAHGLRALFILDYGHPLHADPGDRHPYTSRIGTPEFRAAFARWAVTAVSRYQGRGYLWELWNEPNLEGFWKPRPNVDHYIELVRTTAHALREAGLTGPRGEAIIGPASSTIDLRFIEACFRAGLLEFWDAVSVHPYRQQPPENVAEEYHRLRVLLHRHAPPRKEIPILSGEWGYSAAWAGHDRGSQARFLPRMLLTNLANDVALSIWYDWRDDGRDPKEPEHHFGLVGHEHLAEQTPPFRPHPAYFAAQTLIEHLRGFRYNKALDSGRPDTPLLLFSRGDEVRLAAWRPDAGAKGADAAVAAADGDFRHVVIGAEARPDVRAANGRLPLPVSDSVSLLVPREPNHALILAAAWQGVPSTVAVRQEFPASLDLVARNPLSRAILVGGKSVDPGRELPSQHPVSGARVARDEELAIDLTTIVAGRPYVFTQRTRVAATSPLTLVRYPRVHDTLPVRVMNPGRDAFRGRLDVSRPDGGVGFSGGRPPPPVSVQLADGEADRLLLLPLPRAAEDPSLQLVLRDERQRVLATHPLGRERSLPWSAGELRAFADGTPGTQVDHRFTVATPPEGPPLAGVTSVRLTYRFGDGWSFLQVQTGGDATGSEFGLWIHGDARGAQPRIRFRDRTGQVFQSDGPRIDWHGWRYVTFPLQPRDETRLAHWEGANDGQVHPPTTWESCFLLDNVSRQPLEGELYLAAPTLFQ